MQKVVAMTCDVVEERDLRGLVDGQDEVLVQDDPEISNCGQADSTVQWLEADGQGSVKEAAAFPAAGVTTPCGAPPRGLPCRRRSRGSGSPGARGRKRSAAAGLSRLRAQLC